MAASLSPSDPLLHSQSHPDPEWRRSVRTSLILHGAILLIALFQALVFPPAPSTRHAPTLRVDLVGLPDQLKSESRPTATQTTTPGAAPADTSKTETPPKPSTTSEEAATRRPQKKPAPTPRLQPSKNEAKSPRETRVRQSQLQGALARAKALARVREAYAPQKQSGTVGAAIKGNQVSAGTSLSGEARENAEAHYYDTLRDRLIENWALPVWLSRQKLSAQVLLRLDGRGRILVIRFRQSSGNQKFDEEVQRAIRASEPFPPPPVALQRWVASEGVVIGFPL